MADFRHECIYLDRVQGTLRIRRKVERNVGKRDYSPPARLESQWERKSKVSRWFDDLYEIKHMLHEGKYWYEGQWLESPARIARAMMAEGFTWVNEKKVRNVLREAKAA